jgi:hypothetical protein
VRVGGIIAGIALLAAAAVLGPRIVTRLWRDPGYAEFLTGAGRVLPFGYATQRGTVRGALPLWAGLGCVGAGCVVTAALIPGPARWPSPALVAATVCFGLGLGALGLWISVIWFNRPLRLAPPPMRGDEGLVTAWWRCRTLPPAQRRAAARARRRWPALGSATEPPARSGRPG